MSQGSGSMHRYNYDCSLVEDDKLLLLMKAIVFIRNLPSVEHGHCPPSFTFV